ncbi:MAG TPA: hypothetical protein VH142_15040, partial [Polyangiaceae bacterium]|nr:hypothetical protein [Polyangiaceae bacterium]
MALPVGFPSCSVFDGWFPSERPPRAYSASRIEPSDFAAVLPPKPREPEPAIEQAPQEHARVLGGSLASRPPLGTPPARAAIDPTEPSSDAAESDATKLDDAADPEPVLVSTAKETVVYARPTTKSPKLGYLRAGAIVTRADKPAAFDGCRGGFYEIGPEGYVCAGPAATLSRDDLSRAVPRRADRAAALPYVYGLASSAGSPLYSRIPSDAEQRAAEPDLASHLARGGATSFDAASLDDVPWFLENGAPSIRTNGHRFSADAAELRQAIPRTGFAFVSLFESGHRRFGLTSDMAIVPLDRFTRVEPSRFHGIPLGDADGLPVVFVR